MYKTIIMPVDVFEMELSDKAVRHAEFLAQDDGVIHLLHVLPGSASLSLHRLPLMCVVLKSICNMKQKNVCKRWSATSPSILPALSNMSVLVACGMKSMSWQKNWGLML